jgi:formylglycine-generating enzyme
MTPGFNPYVPRPIDLPAEVPLGADADLSTLDEAKIFAAPADPASWPAWRSQLTAWRADARRRLDYTGEHYEQIPLDCLSVCMAWLWDETLYDHERGEFTVDAYVDAGERDFGGFDGVALWHAYPIVGIDERDHFDFYRDVPELPEVVRAFQRRGVKAYLTYYPWETGDAPQALDEVAKLVEWTDADGVFLDSTKEGSRQLRTALDAIRPGITLEGESRVPLARIEDHAMSWAQWFADSDVPGVLRAKWFERRHVLHHVRRWNRSHLDELHSAWLNGTGVLVWESVFGVWVGWSERDRALLRAMRRVHRGHAAWLRSEDWTPLADHAGGEVYASRWIHQGQPLWTVVNRGGEVDGPWLVTDPATGFVDLLTGQPLTVTPVEGGKVAVGGQLAAGGIAAVGHARPAERHAPAGGDPGFPARAAVRRPVPVAPHGVVPEGMLALDGGRRDLVVRYRVRETGLYGEAPYVDEWKPLPPRLHAIGTLHRTVTLNAFAIAAGEVTHGEYAAFLAATGFRPARPERFTAGQGPADRPVTNVELADARAYAAWAGLRLPTEDEWQVAAEAGLLRRTAPLVWELTESEHTDGRTRFVILKGGADFRAEGSDWYLDGGPQPPEVSVKLLIAGAGLTRSPNIGFRCAADLTGDVQ